MIKNKQNLVKSHSLKSKWITKKKKKKSNSNLQNNK